MKTEQNLAVNQWEKINESEVGESDLERESAATAQGLTRQLDITLSRWAVILVRFQGNKDVSANQRRHSARLHLSQPA
jgi:hypothetical protein